MITQRQLVMILVLIILAIIAACILVVMHCWTEPMATKDDPISRMKEVRDRVNAEAQRFMGEQEALNDALIEYVKTEDAALDRPPMVERIRSGLCQK